ncbi:MAG: hypothetical protein F6K04_14110 [Leptolyngbya sp. SIO4C5]|nr:hypothetical protein [Leptolyngbya sp. SIO4C5]
MAPDQANLCDAEPSSTPEDEAKFDLDLGPMFSNIEAQDDLPTGYT